MIYDINTITDRCQMCGKEFELGESGYKIDGKYVCKYCQEAAYGFKKPVKEVKRPTKTVTVDDSKKRGRKKTEKKVAKKGRKKSK